MLYEINICISIHNFKRCRKVAKIIMFSLSMIFISYDVEMELYSILVYKFGQNKKARLHDQNQNYERVKKIKNHTKTKGETKTK